MSVRVTVLMAVYNGEPYLKAAVHSILQQDYADFEFVIVDDASTDATPEILAGFDDPRLRIVRNVDNLKLGASLNRGLGMAKGEFIARHDADDEALPHRLSRQVSYLDQHPEIGVLGSQMEIISGKGRLLGRFDVPLAHPEIAWWIAFGHAFGHPSVTMRRDVLEATGGYDPRLAEDHDLWTRLAFTTGMANLPDVLVRYRVHQEMTSQQYYGPQWQRDLDVRQQYAQQVLGRRISRNVLRWLRPADDKTMAGGLPQKEIAECAEVVLEMCRVLPAQFPAPAGEYASLSNLAGEKLYGLAAQAARNGHKGLATKIWLRAVGACPSLLAPSTLFRTVKGALQRKGERR